jgi:hypothetical protein
VVTPDYGFFTAAQFAMKPIRRRNIPSFRDLYAELLAQNPRTQFDVIAHSNGTYIVAESLRSTPSMIFRNVELAAPVLPKEFPWRSLFDRAQLAQVRYDVAQQDWPVGILCPALRALGFHDVGPAGLVSFGDVDGWADGSRVAQVGWYPDGHGAALTPPNRAHLLTFVGDGKHFGTGAQLLEQSGGLAMWSRLTPYLVWAAIIGAVLGFRLWRTTAGRAVRWRTILMTSSASIVLVYALLDSF